MSKCWTHRGSVALALAAALLAGTACADSLPLSGPGPEPPSGASFSTASLPRTVAVHLFEWRWEDVAMECEQFLGPKGFSAVQVSPPQEHAVLSGFPWYQRYQPVSYQLASRSGNRTQFENMVRRCKDAGVDIYVDAVINHMTSQESGTGSGGSSFTHYDYPGTYAPWDFHYCGTDGHEITTYQDAWIVRNCELENLADLDTGSEWVRNRIAAYLQDLVNLGVAGFRFDASKHIHPDDIAAIQSRVSGTFYVFQEVIDQGGEPITASEYFSTGDVTEFKYSKEIGRVFKEGQLAWLETFGEAWGFMPTDEAVVFTDNHDNQRGHGGGGNVVTFKDGRLYDLANVFMLAWPYGYPKVMSSYDFTTREQGPPSDAAGNTNAIYAPGSTTPDCFDEWKCEHRWRPITNMVAFRNYTNAAFYVTKWWSNGANQIAFGRGDRGYVIINKESGEMDRWFDTGMAPGSYCDVWSGERTADGTGCTGLTITVNSDGWAHARVPAWTAVAIHGGQKVS
jgi:alpha-amylase